MTTVKADAATLRALYLQIEDICRHFKQIRQEAAGIIETTNMPDAALHLNDVLEATENATTMILDTAAAIGTLTEASAMCAEDKEKMNEYMMTIYEACSFQDISGQRIKKVLKHLSALEGQLSRLSETARGAGVVEKQDDGLLNGPALASEAPSQAEIDALFKT